MSMHVGGITDPIQVTQIIAKKLSKQLVFILPCVARELTFSTLASPQMIPTVSHSLSWKLSVKVP